MDSPPACGAAPIYGAPDAPADLPWQPTFFMAPWGLRDPECIAAFSSGAGLRFLDLGSSCGNTSASWCTVTRAQVIRDPDREVFAWISTRPEPYPFDEHYAFSEDLRVCGHDAGGALACTDPIVVGHMTCQFYTGGSSGADGFA
jgi:hypothetical protein